MAVLVGMAVLTGEDGELPRPEAEPITQEDLRLGGREPLHMQKKDGADLIRYSVTLGIIDICE